MQQPKCDSWKKCEVSLRRVFVRNSVQWGLHSDKWADRQEGKKWRKQLIKPIILRFFNLVEEGHTCLILQRRLGVVDISGVTLAGRGVGCQQHAEQHICIFWPGIAYFITTSVCGEQRERVNLLLREANPVKCLCQSCSVLRAQTAYRSNCATER